MIIKCANCNHFKPFYAHGKGPGLCKVNSEQNVINLWSEDERYCEEFYAKTKK